MWKTIYERWKKIAHAIGRVQTAIIMTVVYFLVIPFFSFLRLTDPLRKKTNPVKSFWEPRAPAEHTVERLRHPF